MGMSRQQAIKIISQMIKDEEGFLSDNTVEAHKMAIKALEQEPIDENLHREREQAYMQGYEDASKRFRQEPVLDKLRAEILDNAFSVVNPKNTYEYINVLDLDSIEKILDKYKAEKEQEDGNG